MFNNPYDADLKTMPTNYYPVKPLAETLPEQIDLSGIKPPPVPTDNNSNASLKPKSNGFGKTGGAIAQKSGEIIAFGSDIYNSFSTVQGSNKESTNQAIGLATKGASIGSVAGPWGALIGAAVGGIVGAVDARNDKRKRKVQRDKNVRDYLEDVKSQRKLAYDMKKESSAIGAQGNQIDKRNKFLNNPYG